MVVGLQPETPEEAALMSDFRATIWQPFQELYEDRWDQARWDKAISEFVSKHNSKVIDQLRVKKILPPWETLAAQVKKGPPPFMRPGWVSPLIGRRIDLNWIDHDSYVVLQGSRDGWRSSKVLVIEFWASWCRPCHEVFGHLSKIAEKPGVKLISFNHEGIFTQAETDVPALRGFVAKQRNLKYPIFVDAKRIAINAVFKPGQNLSIPLVVLISTRDGKVHWLGNAAAEDFETPLERILARY